MRCGIAFLPRDRPQRERHARQVLDNPVVQVARDPAALFFGGLDRTPEKFLALVLGAPQPPRERQGQRYLEELEQQEGSEQERGEAQPDVAAGLGDTVVEEVRLEEDRLSAGRLDGDVDL